MTNSYSGNPEDSPMDAVRFLLSDTKDPWLFADEEINYLLGKEGSIYSAAAELAIVQATKYTDRKDKSVGPLSIKYGDIANRWLALAKSLRSRGGRSGGAIAIMTQSSTDHYFKLGRMDNPAVPKRGVSEKLITETAEVAADGSIFDGTEIDGGTP